MTGRDLDVYDRPQRPVESVPGEGGGGLLFLVDLAAPTATLPVPEPFISLAIPPDLLTPLFSLISQRSLTLLAIFAPFAFLIRLCHNVPLIVVRRPAFRVAGVILLRVRFPSQPTSLSAWIYLTFLALGPAKRLLLLRRIPVILLLSEPQSVSLLRASGAVPVPRAD